MTTITRRKLNKTVTVTKRPANMFENESVQVESIYCNEFVNLYVRANDRVVRACLSATDADKVRDLLIEARPLPTVQPTPARKSAPRGEQQYRGNGNHKWEEVTGDAKGAGHTYRLRVPGGWLYRTVSVDPDYPDNTLAQSTVFVPVPDAVGYAV